MLAGFLLQIAFELLSRVVRVLGGVVVGWVAGWGLSVGPLDGAGRSRLVVYPVAAILWGLHAPRFWVLVGACVREDTMLASERALE